MKLAVYARNHANMSDWGKDSDKEYWLTIKPMINEALDLIDGVAEKK